MTYNFYCYLLSYSLQQLAQLWQLLVSGCLPHSLSLHLIMNCKPSYVLPGQRLLEAAGLQCKEKGVSRSTQLSAGRGNFLADVPPQSRHSLPRMTECHILQHSMAPVCLCAKNNYFCSYENLQNRCYQSRFWL